MGSALPGSSANGWMLLWIGGVRLRGGAVLEGISGGGRRRSLDCLFGELSDSGPSLGGA